MLSRLVNYGDVLLQFMERRLSVVTQFTDTYDYKDGLFVVAYFMVWILWFIVKVPGIITLVLE